MKKPKRLIALFILLIVGQLIAIAVKIYIKKEKIIVPTSSIPPELLLVLSTLLGIASVILCLFCLKGVLKARKLLFSILCLKSGLSLGATLTTDFAQFKNDHPTLPTGENLTAEFLMTALTLALYYWMLYSKKVSQYLAADHHGKNLKDS